MTAERAWILASIGAAIVGGACGALDRRSERIAEWAARPPGAFAHLEVNFGSRNRPSLEGFDAELEALVGAPVHHVVTNPGVRYWVNFATPCLVDVAAVHALALGTPERPRPFYEIYFATDWRFEPGVAIVRDTGQRFPTVDGPAEASTEEGATFLDRSTHTFLVPAW